MKGTPTLPFPGDGGDLEGEGEMGQSSRGININLILVPRNRNGQRATILTTMPIYALIRDEIDSHSYKWQPNAFIRKGFMINIHFSIYLQGKLVGDVENVITEPSSSCSRW